MRSATNDVVTTKLHGLFDNLTSSTTGISILVQPTSLGTRASTLGDSYSEFRVKSLRFRLIPTNVTAATNVVTYTPGIVDTLPTSIATAASGNYCAIMGRGQTTPSNWITVSAQDCAGAANWYKSVSGTPASWDEAPGQFIYTASAASTLSLEFECTLQFKGAIDPGSTPMIAAKRRELERIRLLELLASTPTVMSGFSGGSLQPTQKQAKGCP